MRKHLYVDGTDLATYGVYISGGGTFSGAKREYLFNDIPNKNGSLLGYQRQFLDIDVTYECFVYSNFDTNLEKLRSFLLSRNGRVKIKDDYHPGEYRLGLYQGPFEPKVVKMLNAGSFNLTFRCLPQRWLDTGDTVITITPDGSSQLICNNQTAFDAKPNIRVYGYGDIQISHGTTYYRINISDPSEAYIDIDCETLNCHYGTTDKSAFVAFRNVNDDGPGDPPILAPGNNYILDINYPSSITSIEITPKFWRV